MVCYDRLNGHNKNLELRVGCFSGLGLKGMKHLLVICHHYLDVGLIKGSSRLFFKPLYFFIGLRSAAFRQIHAVVRHHRLRKLFNLGAACALQGKLRECNLSLIAGCCLLNEGLLVGSQRLRTEADPDKTT
jgi:hypothetical protein